MTYHVTISRRCLTCRHFHADEANPAAEERATELR
jgi:hypothetical protein